MFYVQGIAGQEFKGTLEEMRGVRALARTSAVHPVAPHGEEIFPLPTGTHEEAVRAYQSLVQPDLERGPLYHAGQIMRREVVSVLDTEKVAEAWRALREHRIRQAPVLDAGARLVGIVGERELLTSINVDAGRIFDTLDRNVAEVMTSPVVAAAPVTDIRRIARVMLDHDVGGVPILDEAQNLIGFVSRSDILRVVIVDPPLSLWR